MVFSKRERLSALRTGECWLFTDRWYKQEFQSLVLFSRGKAYFYRRISNERTVEKH